MEFSDKFSNTSKIYRDNTLILEIDQDEKANSLKD
jgi:hypothetical protein